MKKLVIVAALVVCAGVSAFAQGQVQFNNRVLNELVSPIFNPQTATPSAVTRGQPTNGTPAGTTTYTGGGLAGTGFTAQLWSGTNGAPASSLSAVVDPAGTTTFRTGGFAGFINGTAPVIAGQLPGATVALQIRVWDNRGGTITSWSQVNSSIANASSDIISYTLGGGTVTPPSMLGINSFSLAVVPEPSTIALGALGIGALLLRRRK